MIYVMNEERRSLSSRQGLVLQRIRVLLVDDHAMLRKGLHTLLDCYDNLKIIGERGEGEEAVSMAERQLPDVVVMDINLGTGVLQFTRNSGAL
jgi:DNA-binding NarL/FixJ family response regulator